mgnify:FL=1
MKKLLAMALALVMALSVTTISWANEEGAEGGEAAAAGLDEVYVSHSKGDDGKDGTTVDNAVKTLRKAMELVKENGTVMIVDTNDCDKCPNNPPCEGGKGYFFQAGSGTYITKPVTFKGVGEQRVALTGMVKIPAISGTVRFENLSFESKWNNVENKSGAPDLTLEFVDCGFPNMTGVSTLNVGTVASLTVQGCDFTVGANGYLGNYLIWGTASIITIKDNNIDGGDCTRGAINLGSGTATGTTATITGNTIKGFERGVQVAFNNGTQNTVNISSNVFENISHKEGSNKQEHEVAAVFLHENLAAEGVKTTVTVAADNTMTNAPRTIYAEDGVTVTEIVAAPAGAEVVDNGDGSYSVVEKTPEQPPRYYYNSTTTTKDTGKTSSPKTFDAGVGIYALTAVLSVTGVAYVGKKKF